MRILITGASGFLGRYLEQELNKHHKYDIITTYRQHHKLSYKIVCDFLNEENCKWLMDAFKPECIIHTAGIAVNKPDFSLFEQNVKMASNVIKYAPRQCQFIHTSSIVVYGDSGKRCTVDMPTNPTSLYGASKLAIEGLVNSATACGLIRGQNLRLTALVGPNPTHGLLKAYWEKINNDNPILEGIGKTPGSIKPYTHLSDAYKAIVWAIENADYVKEYPNLNIGPPDELSCLEVANIMMETIGKFKPVKFIGEPTVGDNSLLHIEPSIQFGDYMSSENAIRKATKELIDASNTK